MRPKNLDKFLDRLAVSEKHARDVLGHLLILDHVKIVLGLANLIGVAGGSLPPTLENWEDYLTELKALPSNTLLRDELIEEAERVIARKRHEVQKSSQEDNRLPAKQKTATARLKPDFGLRLLKDGIPLSADHWFYDFNLFSISVLGGRTSAPAGRSSR